MIVTGKPTLPAARILREAIYARDSFGCCLHIFLDDGNTGLRSIQFCLDRAVEALHVDCMLLADMAMRMSRTQRRKLATGR